MASETNKGATTGWGPNPPARAREREMIDGRQESRDSYLAYVNSGEEPSERERTTINQKIDKKAATTTKINKRVERELENVHTQPKNTVFRLLSLHIALAPLQAPW
jgi:hypothetical protein